MLPLFFLALSCITVKTPEKHADYVVLGKSINHRQSPDGELAFLNMVFFGEIFRTKNGIVTNGYLLSPGEASGNLRFSEGDVLLLAGKVSFPLKHSQRIFLIPPIILIIILQTATSGICL